METGFVGQDNDFAPFFLPQGHALAKTVLAAIEAGSITDLFMVLKVGDMPFPGVSAQPPLIGLDGGVATPPGNDVPIFGLSYTSADGVTFTQNTALNFRFSLGWRELP